MVNGKKTGAPNEGIRWTWRPLAALILVAVLGFWWLQWQGAPSGADVSGRAVATEKAQYGAGDRDSD